MKFARVQHNGERFYCALTGDRLRRLKTAPFDGVELSGEEYGISDVRLLAPCEPTKIVCIGKNYSEHAAEMKEGQPEEPLLFLKPTTCVVGPDDAVIYPELSHRVDYEGELAIVIGKKATRVPRGDAAGYIFGYTCAVDVTARDIQKSDPQWTRGKGFDTFCPLGPWMETELDAGSAELEFRLNGEVRQHGNTADMTHDVDKLIWYITACMTLLPGDVVLTGTPAGIGSMARGDRMEIEIAGIGVLRNVIE